MNIDTIVFDLGGVIVDLDEKQTTQKFAELANQTTEQIIESYQSSPIFQDFEKGLITPTNFRDGLREMMLKEHSDQELDNAWNAMILDVPKKRLEFINSLRKKFNVYILSNTNSIHVDYFTSILQKNTSSEKLDEFADLVYYSHEMHKRKPDQEIFEELLSQSRAIADNTLFLDDKKENLLGAESVNIHTMHIHQPDQIFTLEEYVSQ